MVNKAYIVINKEQEQKIISNLYNKRSMWPRSPDRNGNYWSPVHGYIEFPYVITDNGERLNWTNIEMLTDEEIVYDGRKEEHMSEKYVVSQEFMNELQEWKETYITDTLDEKYHYASAGDLIHLPGMIKDWWIELNKPTETNSHLISIIRWVNGEDVFEVEKPKKWVVRSKEADNKGNYMYGYIVPNERLKYMEMAYGKYPSAYFDTKEEAESWANSHQEVVEVEE